MLNINYLNQNQKKAVCAPFNVPIVVIAGAGTGKTKVLTSRIMYLLDELEFNYDNILALTFTNKAAYEMKERIEKAGYSKITWMSTYSSLGLRILKEEIGKLRRDSNFVVIDEQEQSEIILSLKKKMNAGLEKKLSKSPRVILGIISGIYSGFFDNVYEEEFNSILSNKKFWLPFMLNEEEKKQIFDIFIQYHETKKNNNYVDYDDLLSLPLLIFKKNKDVVEKWRKRFAYILVDEFQDTSFIQFTFLLYLLDPSHNNLFVVGDPDQTIYTWRGAYPQIFQDLYDKFPNCIKITLDKNYRSIQHILDAGNKVIANNKNREDKKLVSDIKEGELVNIYIGDNKEKQWNFVISEIEKLKGEYSYRDIAILYRSKNETSLIENKFAVKKMPYKIFGGIKFWQRREIKDIVAFLKFMINPNDELALIRIINFSRVGIGETRINNIAKSAFEKKISFYDELENMENEKIQNFVNQINNIKDTCFNLTVSKALTKIVEMSFYHDFLMNEYEINDAKERIENVNELIVTATEKEKQMKEDVSISEFLAEISLYITANDSINENNKDYISLMTIHHAKGLEFKVVFVVGMVDGIFPSSNAENYEEERRLAYVAITRAKERLYLCGYKEILGYLKSRWDSAPSFSFIQEATGLHTKKVFDSVKTLTDLENSWFDSTQQTSVKDRYNEEAIDINVGDSVVHTLFGEGHVVGVSNDYLDIVFNDGKRMTVNAKHKAISKKIN